METLKPIGDASPLTEAESSPIFTMGDLEPEKPKLTPDVAAIRSSSYELSFGGKGGKVALEPFSKIRQIASQCIGVEIFNNPNLWAELDEKRSYNGILRDAVFVVFLCVHPLSVSKQAVRIPSKVANDALDWWERHGGGIGSKEHAELMEAFGSIVEDVFSVMAETANDGSPQEDDGLGE
jgi:hypothetical protein